MTPSQQKYFEEYEKFKNVPIEPGMVCFVKSKPSTVYRIVSVETETESVIISNSTGITQRKTLHWCRKNLAQKENSAG
jgi:hypothetical protein